MVLDICLTPPQMNMDRENGLLQDNSHLPPSGCYQGPCEFVGGGERKVANGREGKGESKSREAPVEVDTFGHSIDFQPLWSNFSVLLAMGDVFVRYTTSVVSPRLHPGGFQVPFLP